MKLTDIKIKKAKSDERAYKLFDGGGLYMLIEPTGGKLWRYKYRFEGKEKKLILGKYPEVSLQDARKRHCNVAVMRGAKPIPSILEPAKR